MGASVRPQQGVDPLIAEFEARQKQRLAKPAAPVAPVAAPDSGPDPLIAEYEARRAATTPIAKVPITAATPHTADVSPNDERELLSLSPAAKAAGEEPLKPSPVQFATSAPRLRQKFDTLAASGIRDTLQQITPQTVVYEPDMQRPRATQANDTVRVGPNLLEPPGPETKTPGMTWMDMVGKTPDLQLAHEFGHGLSEDYFSSKNPDPKLKAAWNAVLAGQVKPAEYGYMDPKERFAEAFANGIQYLRETQQAPDTSGALRPAFEGRVPGTMAVVDYLLSQRIYANHPLNAPTPRLTATPPAGKMAAADASRVGSDALPEKGTMEEVLARHLTKELNPSESAAPTSLAGRTAFAAGKMLANPTETAKALALAFPEAGATLGKFTAQEERKARGKWVGPDAVTPRDAAFAAGQLLVPTMADQALPVLDQLFGKVMAKTAVAAVERGETPVKALAAGWAAHVATHAGGGAAIGAVFSPDDPKMGALLGAVIGGAKAATEAPHAPKPAPVESDLDLSQHPDRLIGERTDKGPIKGTATAAPVPPPSGPDFTVDPLCAAYAAKTTTPDGRAPGKRNAAGLTEVQQRAVETMFDAQAARAARGEKVPGFGQSPREPVEAEHQGFNTPEEIEARDKPKGSTPAEPGPRKFPATSQAITDLATQKGISVDEAATRLKAADYDVGDEAIAQAKKAVPTPAAEHPLIGAAYGGKLSPANIEDMRATLAEQPDARPILIAERDDLVKEAAQRPARNGRGLSELEQFALDNLNAVLEPATNGERPKGSIITDELVTKARDETTPPEERAFIDEDAKIEDSARAMTTGFSTNAKDYVDQKIAAGWRPVRKGAAVAFEKGTDKITITVPQAADYALVASRRKAEAAAAPAVEAPKQLKKPEPAPVAEPAPEAKEAPRLKKPVTPQVSDPDTKYVLPGFLTRQGATPKEATDQENRLKKAAAPHATLPSEVTTSQNRFAVEYEKELRAALAKDPKDFAYGPDEVPGVVEKMVKAIAEKRASIHHSKALKRVAKTLGVKFNMTELAKAAAEAAPEKPIDIRLRKGIAGAIAHASEDLSGPAETSGLTPEREAEIRAVADRQLRSFSDAELESMEQEHRAKAAAHGDRNEDQQANEASFRADLIEQEKNRRDDQRNGRGLTSEEELDDAVDRGEMTQKEADQKWAFRNYSEWRRSHKPTVKGDDIPTFDEWLVDERGYQGARDILGHDPVTREQYVQLPDGSMEALQEPTRPPKRLAKPKAEAPTTASFKEWFGDSKVVDATGKPLIVYHGTQATFDTLRADPLIWAAQDRAFANEYADGPTGRVLPIYLAIRNPVRVAGDFYRKVTLAEARSALGVDFDGDEGPHMLYEFVLDPEFIEAAQRAGHDGITAREGRTKAVVWAAFDPSQVRPADAPRAENHNPKNRYVPVGVDLEDAANSPDKTPFDTPLVKAGRFYTAERPETIDINTPERQQYRADTIASEKARIIAEAKRKFGSLGTKEIGLVIGLPSSGKSSIAVEPLAKQLKAAISDVDDVKKTSDDYAEGWGSQVVYKEAGGITKAIRAQLLDEGISFIQPGLGASPSAYLKDLDELHRRGFTVHLVRVRVSPDEGSRRVVSRFEDGGIFLAPENVDYVGTGDADTYEAAKTHPAVVSHVLLDHEHIGRPVVVEAHNAPWIGERADVAPGSRRVESDVVAGSTELPAGAVGGEQSPGQAGQPAGAVARRLRKPGAVGDADRPLGADVSGVAEEERPGAVSRARDVGRAGEGGAVDGRDRGAGVSGHAEQASLKRAGEEEGRGADRAGRSTAPTSGGDRGAVGDGADTGVASADEGGLHGSEHGDVGRQPAPAEGGQPARVAKTPKPKGLNYRLTDADDIGVGSRATKVKQNLAAIRLLKELRAGDRVEATPTEQATLAKYVGWGAFPGYFDPNHKEYGTKEAKELRDTLTPAEYEEARSSTQNAHYTSPDVVKAMWRILDRFGLREGRVLEPSMGVGNFVGFAPEHMDLGWVGVEKDALTGHIAKYLYPESQIYVSGYEDVALRNASVDVAIGNVPFGQITVYDPKYKHLKGFSIHDYFFAKTLDKVRPGGIIAFITSRYTMDKASQTVRKYIADRADLLGAIRLPNTAFKGNAGTEVVTDLILLRVREKGAAPGGEPWLNLGTVKVGDSSAEISEYYAKHPEMMAGKLGFVRGQFTDHDLVLQPVMKGVDIGTQMDAIAKMLPEHALLADSRPVAGAQQMAVVEAPTNSRPGTYLIHEGKIRQVGLDGTLVEAQVGKSQDAKVRQLIGLRDQARALVKLNTEAGTSDAAIEKARQALEKSYKVFTKTFGPINLEKRSNGVNKNGVAWSRTSYPNRDVIDDDPDLAQVLALEHYDSATDKATPADLVTKGRIIPAAEPITSADTGFDAVVASLGKFGKLDLDYMAGLRDVSVDALKTELKGEIFEDPASGDWEIKAKYLSGNVRDKLVEAKRAAKNDPRFKENVGALAKVVPPDLPASAIRVRFGARWIKPHEYAQFVAHLLGGEPGDVSVEQDEHTGLWEVKAGRLDYSVANQRTYGIGKMSATEIIQASMNSKSLRVTTTVKTEGGQRTYPDKESTALALAKQNELIEKFRAWLFTEDPARGEKLVRRYNDDYNNIVPPKFEGKYLTVPGTATHILGKDFTWYEHQKNAIMRYLQNGNILLAHAPGAGKTYTFIAMAMEARRFGLAKRPMVAVPNHMLPQATREAQQLYPGARILALSTDDTSSKAKAMLAARAASNEWDLIITTHNGMGRIPMSKAAQTEFLREQLNELRDAMASEESKRNQQRGGQRGKPRSVKRLEATIEDYEARLKEMMDAPTDTSMTFEELGVDLLIVDEAHIFKNLNFASRVEGIQIGNTKAATWLHMKTQYLHKINPTHGVIFATGTPITNSIAELWTMQRYVNPRGLKQRGLERFDDWQAIFGAIVSRMEKNTVGNYEVKSRLAKYVNVPAMIQMFREFADVKTIAELNLPRPPLLGGTFKAVVAPEPDGMKLLLAALREQWEALKKMTPAEQIESGLSFLSIGNRAKNAGLDMRLVDYSASDEATYKVDLAAQEILQRYTAHHGYKGAQVVFLDASVDKGDQAINNLGGKHGYSVYAELKRKLVAGGIPAKEIMFSQEADSDAKKKVMFRKVNDGELRVIIGSTSQMGVGTNMQRRLVALHRLDVPWRPDQIEQSEARILRMGNWLYDTGKIPGVEILRYVTEGSYDQYSWDTVLRKARFIAQAMAGDASIAELDEMADESAQGAQLMAAMASNNPLELERAELGQQVAELQAQAQGHRNEQARIDRDIRDLERRLKALKHDEVVAAEDAKVKVDTRGDHFAIALGVTVDRPTITKRPEAGEALLKVLAEVPKGSQRTIGTFGGFSLSAKGVGDSYSVFIESKLLQDIFVQGSQSAAGALAQLEAAMRKIGIVENYPRWIQETEQTLKELEQLTGRTFARAGDLEKAETRLRDVEAELMKQSADAENKGETPPPDTEDYGGGVELGAFFDPITAAVKMWQQANALRRQRLGLPAVPVTKPLSIAAGHLANLSSSVRAIFNPAGLTPEAGHASRIVRAQRGSSDLDVARAHQAIEDVRAALDELSPGANFGGPRWDWYRDMEQGDLTHMNAPLRIVAHTFRKLLDTTRDEIRALGPGHLDTVIENYMPRIYKEGPKITGGAGKQVGQRVGKRPLEGPKSFKKKRSFETLDDALAAGYIPISDNPIDMLLLKVREMRRYLMAQRIKNELKAQKLIKFKKASRKIPDGYLRLNDGAFTVYAARGAEGETRIRGEYVAPADVARIVNNFLSPGLRGNPIYDSYSWLGNTLNMVQLGLSAFHAGFVAFDATVQTAAIGMDQFLTGKGPGGRLGGAGKVLLAGASAATGPLTILPLPAATMSYLRGRRVWHDYMHDASSAMMKQIIDGLTAGGGRAKMDDYYRAGNVDKLRAALRDHRWVKAGLNLPFALIEGSMYPLLEHVVPRMKLGAIYQGLQVEFAKLPQGSTDDDYRRAAAKVIDSVDARLGQMIYDNKFWHRTTKEIMMAGIRSVGWNVGTFDVTVGGVAQALNNLRLLAAGKAADTEWQKVQYLAALAGLVALYGAMYTYLHTGDSPKDWKDFYYPRTGERDRDGNDERMTPATYMKDIFSMWRQGGTLLLHKLHPAIEAAAETINNKDFYGDMIHNPDDPFWTRRHQDMEHIVHDVLKPFSIRNIEELNKRGEGMREKVEGIFGNQAAPRAIVRSAAQNKMAELLARRGSPERTPEAADARDVRRKIEIAYQQGEVSKDSLRRLVRGGAMSQGQAMAMARRTTENPLVSRFKLLSGEDAQTVYALGTEAEKKLWAPYMKRKARRLIRPGAPPG